MSGYVLSVIGAVLLCAVLTAILPDGKMSVIIKSITRLVCVIAIISPILVFLRRGEYGNDTENSLNYFGESVIVDGDGFIQYYRERRIQETQTVLKRDIKEKYQVDAQITLSWRIVTEEYANYYPLDKIQITKIHVHGIEQQTEEVKKQMWEYLVENYCSEVLIE